MEDFITISDEFTQKHLICAEPICIEGDSTKGLSYIACFEGVVRVMTPSDIYEIKKHQLLEIFQPMKYTVEAEAGSNFVLNSMSKAFLHALELPDLLETTMLQKECRKTNLSRRQLNLLEGSETILKVIANINDSLSALHAAKCMVELHYHLVPELKSTSKDQRKDQLVEDFFAHLQAHYAEKYSINMYADLLHVSKSTLAKTLKAYTGKTVMQLVEDEVLKNAQILLRRGRLNCSEIAELIGFSDVASFSHFFKSKTGLTPTEFYKK